MPRWRSTGIGSRPEKCAGSSQNRRLVFRRESAARHIRSDRDPCDSSGVLLLASLIFCRPSRAALVPVAFLFTLYFFRDPERTVPDDPEIAVAPADGKIVAIEDRIESEGLMRRMICVSIFLSVFDVHINRSPIAGRVTHSEGKKGHLPRCAKSRFGPEECASRLWIIEGPPRDCGCAADHRCDRPADHPLVESWR